MSFNSYYPSPHPRDPQSPSKMSITQTFRLAHRARGKLSSEAARQDHNLRMLVGHANLLDSLMIHLAEAEAEQERWYNNTIQAHAEDEDSYGSLAADYESDSSDSESECDESDDEMDVDFTMVEPIRHQYSAPAHQFSAPAQAVVDVSAIEEDEEEYEEYDEEDLDDFSPLERTTSYRPPSLCSDYSDEEDEEVATPPTPPQPVLHHHGIPVSKKDAHIHAVTTSYYHDSPSTIHDDALIDDHHYFEPPSATLISTY